MNKAGIFQLTAIVDPSTVHVDAKTYAAVLLSSNWLMQFRLWAIYS